MTATKPPLTLDTIHCLESVSGRFVLSSSRVFLSVGKETGKRLSQASDGLGSDRVLTSRAEEGLVPQAKGAGLGLRLTKGKEERKKTNSKEDVFCMLLGVYVPKAFLFHL